MIEENKTVDVALGAKLEPLIQSAGYGLYVPKTLKLTFLASERSERATLRCSLWKS